MEIAKLYLRTADYIMKKSCGIYEIKNSKGRVSYKIFSDANDLQKFLEKNKDKICENMLPVYSNEKYEDFPNTEVRKLSLEEIRQYISER